MAPFCWLTQVGIHVLTCSLSRCPRRRGSRYVLAQNWKFSGFGGAISIKEAMRTTFLESGALRNGARRAQDQASQYLAPATQHCGIVAAVWRHAVAIWRHISACC